MQRTECDIHCGCRVVTRNNRGNLALGVCFTQLGGRYSSKKVPEIIEVWWNIKSRYPSMLYWLCLNCSITKKKWSSFNYAFQVMQDFYSCWCLVIQDWLWQFKRGVSSSINLFSLIKTHLVNSLPHSSQLSYQFSGQGWVLKTELLRTQPKQITKLVFSMGSWVWWVLPYNFLIHSHLDMLVHRNVATIIVEYTNVLYENTSLIRLYI